MPDMYLGIYLQASQDNKTNFLKIHAPNIVLERYAEIISMQKPIKVTTNQSGNLYL